MTSFADLQGLLTRTMLVDRHRLRGRLEGIERDAKAGEAVERSLQRLQSDVQRSIARAERRRADMPPITYNEELPVSARKDEIAAAIRREPGGGRLRRDGLGQVDPVAEDLPGAGPRRRRA